MSASKKPAPKRDAGEPLDVEASETNDRAPHGEARAGSDTERVDADPHTTATSGGDGHHARPWQRFAFGGPRTGIGTIVASVLALGVGFALMTQVRQNEKSGLDNLSQPDLVALLADVNDQSSRLETELDELRTSKSKVAAGGDAAAVADAQKRLDELQILNGAVPVSGPGITIRVTNADKGVTSANVLDAVQELRDAGAESIDIDGHRVIASTWFADLDGHAGIAGTRLPSDFTITAIGDPHTMSTAMAIPGGVTDTLTQAGAQVKVAEGSTMKITSIAARH